MYGSRKVNAPKVKFAKTTWDDRLKGVGFVTVDRGEEPRAPSPMAPPSPSPPSPAPPSPQAAEDVNMGQMKEDEFTRHAREQTKTQLESITGRMFQVLNDYEDDGDESEYLDIDGQLNSIPNSQLKANIQLMMADYKDMCVEREELLHSLADWFDEGHIDDIMEDMKHRRRSVAADPEGLRKSLLEGKMASQKLKVINDQIEAAKDQGLSVDHLEDKKAELEKEVMKSAKFMEKDNPAEETQEDVTTKVKDSWKFAAVEIYNLINQVRENGIDDVHEMEDKMRGLLTSMNQQTEIIDKLSMDLKHQRQVAAFSDMTTTQLSGDNSLLKDEVEMLRGELMDANDRIRSLRSEVQLKTLEADRKERAVKSSSKKDKRALDTDMARLELRVSQLTDENTTLQQENQELLMACERLERDVEVAKELFDEEVTGHKAELENLMLSSTVEERQSTSRQISVNMNKTTPLHTSENSPTESDTSTGHSGVSTRSSLHESRTVSAKIKSVTAERRMSQFHHAAGLHHNQDHLFGKLADKEHQLKTAKQELMEARGMVQNMENELEKLKRENAELVKLQGKSAALINQASTCLQMKSDLSSDKSSQQNVIVQPASYDQASHSVIQTTTKTEATVHKTIHVQSSDHRSISHHNTDKSQAGKRLPSAKVNHTHELTKKESTPMATTGSEETKTKSSPNVWSVLNSVDDGSNMFGMPSERTAKEKKVDSIELVMDLIDKVNAQQSDFASADSKALKQVHTELTKVSQLVRNFLEYSTNLINDEAEVVSNAVDSLMEQLPNHEKPDLDGPVPPSGEKPNRLQQQRLSLADTSFEEQKRLKEKAVHFADQAIEMLKAGERMLTTKINTQQNRLSTVLHAMDGHKRRQSQCFKFEAPDSAGLVLEAHAVSKHNIAASQPQQPARKEPSSDYSKKERMERLRRYTGNGRSNANNHLFYAYMRAGRFGNTFQGFGSAVPNTAEDSDELEGAGMGMGINGYGRAYGRHAGDVAQSPLGNGLVISPQVNSAMRHEGTVSLKFGNIGNYQRHHTQQESAATDLTVGSRPRKKAGKLYKPFHSNNGTTNSVSSTSRRDHRAQSRQGQTLGQRQAGRKWESSTYSQQDYRHQDGGSRAHKMSGATFYDLLKHGTRSARATQQTVSLLGETTSVKLPPI